MSIAGRRSQKGAATILAVRATVSLSATTGNGTATLSWTITPHGDPVDGVYAGRDGTDTSGNGPWESNLISGLSGSQQFTYLTDGTEYTLYVALSIGGKRAEVTFQTTATPQGTSTGDYPPYPAMLSGWTMQTSQIDTTHDQGWTHTNGKRSTDLTYNSSANTTFSQGPDSDAMCVTVTWDGSEYHSSDAHAQFCSIPDTFVLECYAMFGPLGKGSWPALWFRPLSGGEGELDLFEWFPTGFANPTDPNSFRTDTIITPYSSPLKHKPTPIDKTGLDSTMDGWHHYRYRKTTTDVTLWIDGAQRAQITRSNLGNYTTADWDTCFASGHTWYFRVTYQFGSGSDYSTADPTVPPTKLMVRDVRIWNQS